MAVGSGSSSGPLVEVSSGGSWTVQTIPTQPGSFGSLTGVSCASPIACIAVGGGLVAGFDGSAWSVQHVTMPPGGTVDFNAVSCSSPDACTVAGAFTSAGPAPFVRQPLVERWDGSNWTIENTPSPANSGELTGLSCASAGERARQSGTRPMAHRSPRVGMGTIGRWRTSLTRARARTAWEAYRVSRQPLAQRSG